MEMSAKFSWVFLLLGFSLVAITLQDVQGGAENDGPTEVDCMPYIEKALKEQAGGEAQKEPSEKNESAEDYPTVEITDDTSAQANDEIDDEAGPYDDNEPQGDAAASVESEEHVHVETRFKEEIKHTEDSKKSEEVAKDKKSTEAAASREVSKEVGQSKEDDDDHSRSEEKAESIEEKEKSKENIERKKSDGKSEETETQQKETKSDEHSIEKEEDESQEDSNEAAKTKESRQTAESVEDLKEEKLKKISKGKDEEHLRHSSKDSKESKEEQESIATTGCPPSDEVNCKDGGARCNKHRHCGEGEICCLNKCYQRKCIPGTPTLEDLADEGSDESEEQQKEAKSAEKAPSGPHTGCPSRNGIPCKEGPVCGKHKQCGEGKICCPNKCYQRKCIAGTPTEEDLAGEESEEESQEEVKSGEKTPLAPSSGCPGADRVPCKDGEPCAKHRHCPGGKICCTNKCYRKQCVAGEATSEELAAEEASAEEDTQEEKKTVEKAPSASKSCPSANHVPCKDGEPCAKHRHCPVGKICCTNKCYRKRCVSGEATSEELAAEEESAEEDEKEEKKTAEKAPSASKSTGCPSFRDLACEKGTSCSKHKHCEEGEMCCVNRCYRRACVPGTPTKDDLAAEGSEESEEQTDEKVASAEKPSAKRTGCPGANKVSCTEGDVCSKHMHCGSGKMCCPNKCYRKRCVSGEPTEEDLAGEEGEESEEEKGESQEAVASEETTGCPAADRVPCKGGPKCTEDEECDKGEICCTNKCYNKKCIPGTPKESVERRKAVSKESKEQEQIESVEEIDEVASIETEEVVSAEVPVQKVVPIVPLKQKPDKPAPPPAVKEKPAPPPARVESKPPTPKVEIREAKNVERVARSLEESSLETGGVDAVEELTLDYEIPSNLRPRNHVEQLLKLESSIPEKETVHYHVYEETLKELKKLYEQAIKPLETLYKYRDLSNRHFGDAEVFSKPLVLFMGPWSGGKSSIINYLVNNEYNVTSLRTGAEPSPAYFNILMYGEEPQIVDGTELAADFTFSGLQKFGQGLEERLRGVKLPSKLLEKVNIVEIPGILEVRKQVSRVFPFNDACQWFIDRADIIFLVYDPAKLDVGPETEAILDQLKGREHQTRIILNKADQVKPEELMRVQGALIWNISPLMSSPHPPVMYTTSLWSKPYEPGAPMRLLQAQERAFLRDLRTAVDNRVEHKISSARRFAVRVRNHAKMVDCYLTTYYNHKSVFGNKNKVANEIIDHPQNYHIYEGLSTLTNISRYDLPDPEAYRDFFRLNPLYEFQPLSATCTYFRGCPINRLDIAIAYDFPELLGTYKRNLEKALQEASAPSQELPAQKKSNKKSKS